MRNHILQDTNSREIYHRQPPSQRGGEEQGGHRDACRFVLKIDPIAEEFEDLQMANQSDEVSNLSAEPLGRFRARENWTVGKKCVQNAFESSA